MDNIIVGSGETGRDLSPSPLHEAHNILVIGKNGALATERPAAPQPLHDNAFLLPLPSALASIGASERPKK